MTCPICGGKVEGDTDTCVNLVCDEYDDRAVGGDGEDPWHGGRRAKSRNQKMGRFRYQIEERTPYSSTTRSAGEGAGSGVR